MKYTIITGQESQKIVNNFEYQQDESKRPMALDVLLQAKATSLPDLAFRYGCRNELCGVCTIEVNGDPRLACRCRVSEGDELAPLSTLPQLRDLVVERKNINRQLQKVSTPPPISNRPILSLEPTNLNSCIECYACLSDCPMHERNKDESPHEENGFTYGNPYTMLKMRKAMLDPSRCDQDKQTLLTNTIALGLDACLDCDGCKCQVGIGLVNEVIEPLLASASENTPGF